MEFCRIVVMLTHSDIETESVTLVFHGHVTEFH